MIPYTIDLSPILSQKDAARIVLSDEQFERLCAANPDHQIEALD